MSILAQNKAVGTKYQILETFQAGLELLGHEVKSVRSGRAALKGSYVKLYGPQAFWVGGVIAPYQSGPLFKGYKQDRPRRLLLQRKELNRLIGRSAESGLTLIPLSLYTKGPWIKMELAVARGLKKYDQREKIKEREFKRRKAKLEGRSF